MSVLALVNHSLYGGGEERSSEPLSPFMMTQMGEPTHRSMSSRGSNCEDIVSVFWLRMGDCYSIVCG